MKPENGTSYHSCLSKEAEPVKATGWKSARHAILLAFITIEAFLMTVNAGADENKWFIYLGSQEAKKAPRKNINAAEALPPLPLPARRYEGPNARNRLSPIIW